VLDEAQIERVLVITAHPDDVDFGAAGTVAGLTDRGVHVTYCIVTDGDAGGFENAMSRAEMAALRREEQTRAAKEVGVDELIFLAQPDGRLQADLGLRELLARVIRQVRPQLVITQHPERNLNRIFATVFSRNPTSARVLQKIGLRHEGTLRQHIKKWDEYIDVEMYAAVRQDWTPARARTAGFQSGRTADF